MGKYIATIDNEGRTTIHVQIRHDLYADANIHEVMDILNSPPPAPPGGIVWRRPGEAGRVDGGRYLVWRCGATSTVWTWTANHEHDGWACAGVVAWAEINPPAWEGESK